MAKTGNQLLDDVQITITMPNNQVLLTDERILSLANDEVMAHVVPLMLSLNEEYFVELDDSDKTVQDKKEYDIPYRAVGRILRDLKIQTGQPDNVFNSVQIQLEDANFFQATTGTFSYYFKGDKFVLVPTPQSQDYTLLKYYLLRPNKIVKTGSAGLVTGITGNIVNLNVVPTTFVNGVLCDFIKGVQGNSTIRMDQAITNVSGNQVTFAEVPDTLVIGDWVALAEESPVLQLPDEAFPYLVFLTAKRCLYAIGDYEGMKAIDEQIPEKRRLLEMILAPRNEGENIKIVNRWGLLRGRRQAFWRGIIR